MWGKKVWYAVFLIFVAVFIGGCGGGGGSSDSFTPSGDNRAILGPVKNAKIKLYDAYSGKLLYKTKTDDKGYFSLDDANVDLNGTYVIEVSGGIDIDSNDDGIEGDESEVKGRVYALYLPAIQKNVNVTFLSDIIYRHVRSSLELISKEELIDYLNAASSKLLKQASSYREILTFDPRREKDKLVIPYERFKELLDAYHQGESEEQLSLVIHSLTDGEFSPDADLRSKIERKYFKLTVFRFGKANLTVNEKDIDIKEIESKAGEILAIAIKNMGENKISVEPG